MFDIGAIELFIIVVTAILVIGRKDMPLALRTAGRWIGKIRRVSTHFRTGIDAMVREAEMEEMEKNWQERNARIMAEHPAGEMSPLPNAAQTGSSAESAADAPGHDQSSDTPGGDGSAQLSPPSDGAKDS